MFAGQRLDGFYVDLGSIFDPAALRPFQNLHLIPTPAALGINALRAFNVHTLAIQIPISRLTSDGSQTDPLASNATIGVYGAAYRRKATLREDGKTTGVGPYVQVSRFGNPLFNEVIVPIPARMNGTACRPIRTRTSCSTSSSRSSERCCRSSTPVCSEPGRPQR